MTGAPRLILALCVVVLSATACADRDPATAMRHARERVAAGERSRAIFDLREFARKHPGSDDVRLLLARLDIEQGDIVRAKEDMAGIGSRAAATGEALDLKIQIALAERRFQDALDELGAHRAALDPSRRGIDEAQGLLALGRAPEALGVLEKTRAANPTSILVAVELARVKAATGDVSGALSILSDAARDRHDPEPLAALGILELRTERQADGVRDLEAALAVATPLWPPTQRWGARLTLADVYVNRRDLPRARSALAALQTEIPNATGVRMLAARIAMLDQRPRDAVTALQTLAQAPQAPLNARLLYAAALDASGNHQQALQIIGGAKPGILLSPSVAAWESLAAAQIQVKDFGAAVESEDAAYGLAPSFQTAMAAFQARRLAGSASPERPLLDWISRLPADSNARAVLGDFYRTQGRSDEAIHEFEAAIAANASNVLALNNLATLVSKSSPERAEALARRAYAAAPGSAAVADTLGWILVARNKSAEALPFLATAANGSRDNNAVQYHYAVALAGSGRTQEARLILESLVLSNRPFDDRPDATRLLVTLSKSTLKQDG